MITPSPAGQDASQVRIGGVGFLLPEPRTKAQQAVYLRRFGRIPQTFAEQFAADECLQHDGPSVRTD